MAIVAAFSQRVYPLDPNRTLTQYVHRIWQVQQGLPEGTLFSIRQTKDGYLWLGTQSGLVRFDGVRFNPVREAQDLSLTNLWVQDLFEDKQQNLWVASDGLGLVCLGHKKAKRYTEVDGLPADNVRCLLADRNGDVWAGTAGGLARLADGKFTVYTRQQGLATVDIHALCQAKDGTIWAAGEAAQISVWNGTDFSVRNLASLPTNASVRAMRSTKDGSIWIGTSNGLVQIKDDKETRFTAADGLADDSVFCLAEGRHKSVWVGTKEGFSRIQNGEIDSFRPRDGLSQSAVYALCEDHEGSLWVGTKHGLNQFSDRRTIPFTVSEGLPSNDAGPVFQDRAGNVWVGTLGAGLGQFDGRRFPVLTVEQGLTSNTITALADGQEGELWVGTDQGLVRLMDRQVDRSFTTVEGLPSDRVRCLFRDHQGILWVGTSAGIATLVDSRFVEPDPGELPPHTPVLALTEQDGHMLLAAADGGGLYRYAAGGFRKFAPEALPGDVDAFYEDSDGLLWLGTRGAGLGLLEGDKIFNYTIQDGLYDDEIYGIVADDKDRLWMACSKGVFSVSRSDLRKFAAGVVGTLTSTPFSPTEALRTIECKSGVQPAAWKMRDGRIWFSTIRGLIVIDPDHLDRKFPPAPVVVEEVIVDGESRSPAALEDLPPGRTNLSFRYTALSFRAPTRIAFRYKLEGFDKDWVEAGSRREAFYTNLSPGSYRFRVAACNVDGTCNEANPPIDITLEPYFYQRRWFLPLCGGLVVAAGWIAYRQRVRRIKEHLQVVLTERSRIARELHDTLMQGFSGVTMEMQALMSRLAPSDERATLDEIIHDAGLCLREARRSVAGLRNSSGENSGLAAAIAQAARQITETKDVRLKLALGNNPPRLPADVEYNLLRIAQEAVSNAVKHAHARTIEVALNYTSQRVRLSVKDDGAGLLAHNGDAALLGHYGLLGIRERAAQIGAEFRLESEPGRGTALYVDVPALQPAGDAAAADTPRRHHDE